MEEFYHVDYRMDCEANKYFHIIILCLYVKFKSLVE